MQNSKGILQKKTHSNSKILAQVLEPTKNTGNLLVCKTDFIYIHYLVQENYNDHHHLSWNGVI